MFKEIISLVLAVLVFFPAAAGAAPTPLEPEPAAEGQEIKLLEPSVVRGQSVSGLEQYLGIAFFAALGLLISLSIVMVVLGGLEYMFSQVPGSKLEGKQRVWAAVLGLVLAVSSWMILRTINPQLLQRGETPQSPGTYLDDDYLDE